MKGDRLGSLLDGQCVRVRDTVHSRVCNSISPAISVCVYVGRGGSFWKWSWGDSRQPGWICGLAGIGFSDLGIVTAVWVIISGAYDVWLGNDPRTLSWGCDVFFSLEILEILVHYIRGGGVKWR